MLVSGSSRRHFSYLFNCTVFRGLANGLNLPKATTRNEAEHRNMKRWGECIYAQHADRLQTNSKLNGLDRMLYNSYRNSESPIETLRPATVCSLISGMMKNYQTRGVEIVSKSPDTQRAFTTPVLRLSQRVVEERRERAKKRSAAWATRLKTMVERGKLVLLRVRRKTQWSMRICKRVVKLRRERPSAEAIRAQVVHALA